MQFVHKSRLLQYRNPFGAAAAGSDLCLKIKLDPQKEEIRAVNLAYTYGLYSFANGRSRLEALPGQDGLYQVRLPPPARPGISNFKRAL